MFQPLLSHPRRQYDVITKIFLQIHFSEPSPLINGNYNIKTNSNNNLKCIKIIKR